MYAWKFLFIFCVFIPLTYQGVVDGKNGTVASGENITKTDDESSSSELEVDAPGRNQSEAEGPPDSHEAMNNRELKPKLTIGSRRKRSYEFLMGLVKRNASLYQITKNDDDDQRESTNSDAKASELLLELLVKIAENPQQWSKVHEMLQKVDKDLMKSKELVDNIKSSANMHSDYVIATKSKTKESPSEIDDTITPEYETTKYPWQLSTKPNRIAPAVAYQKNFAYHRVTGNPLTHSLAASNKNPKAYIAVSVIAPKPMHQTANNVDELTLENELKELKPWSHQQNLKNMADIRSRWVIQNDQKPLYAP